MSEIKLSLDAIIKKAITDLIKVDSRWSGTGSSAIEDAFSRACRVLAAEMASQYVRDSPEFRAAIQSALERAAAKAMIEEEKLTKLVVRALAEAMREEE
jgi:hypothetical protein